MIQHDQSITPEAGGVSAQPEASQRSPLSSLFGRLQEIAVVAAGYLDTSAVKNAAPEQHQRLKDFLGAASASVREAAEQLDGYLQIRSERNPSLQEVGSTGLAITKAAEKYLTLEKSLSAADRTALESSEDGRVILAELRQSFRELMQTAKAELPAAYALTAREVSLVSAREKALVALSDRFQVTQNQEDRELEVNLAAAVRGIPDTLDEDCEQFEEVSAHACLLERQALDRGENPPGHQVFVETLRENLLSEIAKSEVLVTRNAAALSEYYALLEAKLENPLAPVTMPRSQRSVQASVVLPVAERPEFGIAPSVSNGSDTQSPSVEVLEVDFRGTAGTTAPQSSAPAEAAPQNSGGVLSGMRGKIAAIAALAVVGIGSWFAATRSGREAPRENGAIVAAEAPAASAPKETPPVQDVSSTPAPVAERAEMAHVSPQSVPEAAPPVAVPSVAAATEAVPAAPQPAPAEPGAARLKANLQPIAAAFNETWLRIREAVAARAREFSERAQATPVAEDPAAATSPVGTDAPVAVATKEIAAPQASVSEPTVVVAEKQTPGAVLGLGALQNDLSVIEEAPRSSPTLGSTQSPLAFDSTDASAAAAASSAVAERPSSPLGALSTPFESRAESAASAPAASGLGASQSSLPAEVVQVPAAVVESGEDLVLGSRGSELTLAPNAVETKEAAVVSVPSGTVLRLGGLVSAWNEDVIASLRSSSAVPQLPPLAPVVIEPRAVETEEASAVAVRPLPESVAGLGALQSDAAINPRESLASKPAVLGGGQVQSVLGSLQSEFVLAEKPGEDIVSRSNVPLPERREYLGSLQSPLELTRPAVVSAPSGVAGDKNVRLGSLGSPMSENEASHAAAAAGETVASIMLQESLPPYIRPASSPRKKPASN